MKRIALSQGKIAIVDDRDFPTLMAYRWWAVQRNDRWYAQGQNGPKRVYMHRIILKPPHGLITDHKNRNGLDNRRRNLRACTYSQNLGNSRIRKKKSSRFKGVFLYIQKNGKLTWKASITINRKQITRVAPTELAAKRLYDAMAKKYWGEFARR